MNLNQDVHGIMYDNRDDGVSDFVDAEGNISRKQYIGDILKDNNFLQNRQKYGVAHDEGHIVASIPVAVIDIAKSQGIDLLNDEKALRAFLNDSSNRMFRTTLERV